MIGTIMAEPTRSLMTGSGGIGAIALADLLGHWPAADGPLYRLLATRIARLSRRILPVERKQLLEPALAITGMEGFVGPIEIHIMFAERVTVGMK